MFEFVLITFLACSVPDIYCSRYNRLEGRVDVMEKKQSYDSACFRSDIKILFEKLSNISNDESSPDYFGNVETKLANYYVSKLDGAMKAMKRSFQEEKQHSREVFDQIKARVKRHEELCSTNVVSIKNVLEDGFKDIRTKHIQMNSRLDDIDSVLKTFTSQQQQTQTLNENILAKMDLQHDHLVTTLEKTSCGTWKHFNNACYYLGKDAVNFDEAIKRCQNMNAYLVEIESDEENKFLTELAENEKTGVRGFGIWVGGTDVENEGIWTWYSSKRIVDFTSWGSGEPNGGTRENCLHLYNRYSWLWNDARCSLEMSYICEKSI